MVRTWYVEVSEIGEFLVTAEAAVTVCFENGGVDDDLGVSRLITPVKKVSVFVESLGRLMEEGATSTCASLVDGDAQASLYEVRARSSV